MSSEGGPGAPAGPAAGRWAEELAGWAIPPHILDAAPVSPWEFSAAVFAGAAEQAIVTETPSQARAIEALRDGGSVLDVGVGAGAASLPLVPPAATITGVDSSQALLDAFAQLASARGVNHRALLGSWPAVAAQVEPADVCVCHHVVYNVADLGPFVGALTSKARQRVVVELTASHPQSNLNDLWWHFHHIERPSGPTADGVIAVLAEVGIGALAERWTSPSSHVKAANANQHVIASVRRRLCLPPEREPELAERLDGAHFMAPREMVTLWWPGSA